MLALLLGVGVLIVACSIYGTSRRKAPITLGLALLLASLAATLNLSLSPAFADEAPVPCPTPTTAPVSTWSVTPAPVQTTASAEPTATPAPIPTPTPTTPPLPSGSISGTYTRAGQDLIIHDPPGYYLDQFALSKPGYGRGTSPDGTLVLPDFIEMNGPIGGMTMNLTTPGTDGVLGTADDQITATTQTAPDGKYIFANLPAGQYRVVAATLPADPIISSPSEPMGFSWAWAVCTLNINPFPDDGAVAQPNKSLRYQILTPAAKRYDVMLAENQMVTGQDFNAQGMIEAWINCH